MALPEAFRESIMAFDVDPAELQARRIHEQRSAESSAANQLAKDPLSKDIARLEQGIKDSINVLVGNQDGEKRIVFGTLEARELLSRAIGDEAQNLTDGVEIILRREMPVLEIIIDPVNVGEKKYTQMLHVNGPLTASDLTALARQKIRNPGKEDPVNERLKMLEGWTRVVSYLQEVHPLKPAKQPQLAA